MSWKLDNIDFTTYHVRVTRAQGVLDMPKLIDKSRNWLDEDGVDFWQPLSEMKYQDREIILNCYIKATSEAEFQSRLNTFYTALHSGMLTLTPPFGDPIDCYVNRQVMVERKTKYVTSYQVGVFLLRLTVPGDEDAHALTISRWTGTANIVVATVYTSNFKVNKTLQGDIYATCSFESATKLDLKYFDFIYVNSNGANNDMFHLATDPQFKKNSTNKYVYDLRWEHQGTWLSNSQFLNINSEADFYYHANMDEIVDLVVSNHNRSWWNNFEKGTVATTERKLHKFSAEDCLAVLRRLCAEYDLEYEFEYVSASRYKINIKEQVANDTTVTLEYGKGKGLYELSREPVSKKDLCTILYAYGSTKNIKPGYRGGLARLSFDGNPLKNNEDLYTGAGPHERTVYFDDIFPNRTASVTAYEQVLPDALTDAQKQVYPDGIYRVADSTLDFNINDYMLGGLSAKIRMKTGDCAGREFEVLRYEHDTFSMYLVPWKDSRGEVFPNATLTINIGDEYTLVDIDQPASYVAIREAELAAAAAAYLANHSTPNFPYRCTIDPAFMDANPGGFEVGDRVTIIDADYSINGLFRISNLVYDVYKQTYEFTLSDTARLTRRQQMELRLEAIERAQEAARKDESESNRDDIETTGELKRRLFDIDDKLDLDKAGKPESVDGRHMSYDAISLLWTITSVFEENADDNEDKASWTYGEFIIHNWASNTLDRYAREKIRAADGDYDPSRTWIIIAGDYTLPTKAAYYIYAKLNTATGSTECTIVFSTTRIDVKAEAGYLYYELGNISAGEE